jgi:hypothetical protein
MITKSVNFTENRWANPKEFQKAASAYLDLNFNDWGRIWPQFSTDIY